MARPASHTGKPPSPLAGLKIVNKSKPSELLAKLKELRKQTKLELKLTLRNKDLASFLDIYERTLMVALREGNDCGQWRKETAAYLDMVNPMILEQI